MNMSYWKQQPLFLPLKIFFTILEAMATFFATKNFTYQHYEYVIQEATATFFATKIFIFFMILEAIATFFATKNLVEDLDIRPEILFSSAWSLFALLKRRANKDQNFLFVFHYSHSA